MKRSTNKPKPHISNSKSDTRFKELSKVTDLSSEVICVLNEEGKFLFVSSASKRDWGYNEEELIGNHFIEIIQEEDQTKAEEELKYALQSKEHSFKIHIVTKDNNTRYVQWNIRWGTRGKLLYALAKDLSYKKSYEEKVKKDEEKFRQVLERISDAFVALDNNWHYTYMNNKAGEIFNVNPQEMIGKNIWKEFPEGIDQPFYKAYYKAMEEQNYIYLEEYYAPYDKWFVNHIYPSADGLSIYFNDITDRKKEEERIRIKDERLIKSQEIGNLGYWEYERNSPIMWASEKTLEIFGFPTSSSEVLRKDVEACIPDLEKATQAITDLIEKGIKHEIEYLIHPADGSEDKYILSIAEVERNEDGSPLKIMGIVQDITERVESQKKLKRAYEGINNILESITDGFLTVNKNWTVNYWNKAAENIMHMSRDEIIYKNLWDVYAIAIPTRFYTEFNKAMSERISIHFEDYFAPLDRWFGINIYPTKDGISVFFQDISEKKHQEQLSLLEKETLKLYTTSEFSLEGIIRCLLLGVSKIHPGMLCSVQRIKDGKMYELSSHQLPKNYSKELEGIIIGEDYGSFGAAAYLKAKVEVADISAHPFQQRYKDLAAQYNIQASFSYPILDSKNQLLAVFTAYYKESHLLKASEPLTIERVRIILANIIEDKLAEEALNAYKNQLELIFNTTTDSIFLLAVEQNYRYRFITINKAFLSTTGLKKEDIEGKYVDEVIPKESLSIVLKNYKKAIKEKRTILWEEKSQYPTGIKIGVVSISPIYNESNQCTRLLGVIHDITERKEHEQAINRSNNELKRFNQELKEKNTKLEDIAWIQSHKVRAPVANIMGLVVLIKKHIDDPKENDTLLDYLLTSAHELDKVIREIVKKTEQIKKDDDATDLEN